MYVCYCRKQKWQSLNEQKLIGYCLDHEHEKGKHKARVFKAALGITIKHYKLLKNELLACILTNDANYEGNNGFGDIYSVDAFLHHEGHSATVRSVWIIMQNESFPRLVSCYVIENR